MELADQYFVDNAKVMAKGQITLPKDVRNMLRVGSGDRVTLVCEGDKVIMMNAAIYAMKMFQAGMTGEAEKAGIRNDDDINALIADMRHEDNK